MATEQTVYVLDDDDAVLRSLERLLSSANFKPITFDHPSVFLTAAKTFKTGCVLLDVRLPGMSGLEVQAQLLKMRSDLAIIVVTGQGDIQTAVRAMKAGAADFIEEPYDDEALLGSIEAALRRETDLGIADAVRRVAALSTREREVLDGLLAGRANKLIAYDLGISVRTVEVHRARMMERLGLRQLSDTCGSHGEAKRLSTREYPNELGRNRSSRNRPMPGAIEPIRGTVFQSPSIQDFDRSRAYQGNNRALLQIRDGTRDCFDGNREIFGDVIARDRQFHLSPSVKRSFLKPEQKRADFLDGGDASNDRKLLLDSSKGLECDLTEFPCELPVASRKQLDPSAGIACKHCLLGDRLDGILPLTVGNKEKILRQHQIDNLSPPVRTDRAAPYRANDNVIPVARGP
jgi:two-component system response regulator FixJ